MQINRDVIVLKKKLKHEKFFVHKYKNVYELTKTYVFIKIIH